jgi:hypothetical protein
VRAEQQTHGIFVTIPVPLAGAKGR